MLTKHGALGEQVPDTVPGVRVLRLPPRFDDIMGSHRCAVLEMGSGYVSLFGSCCVLGALESAGVRCGIEVEPSVSKKIFDGLHADAENFADCFARETPLLGAVLVVDIAVGGRHFRQRWTCGRDRWCRRPTRTGLWPGRG